MRTLLFVFLTIKFFIPFQVFASNEVNIYSHRQPFLINPFLEEFTRQTGIKTNVVYAKKGLAERLQAEGKNTPADLILTVDIARLHVYADKDLLAKIDSNILHKNIPEHLRSHDNTWFALSKRARVIAVKKDLINSGIVNTYEDLADPILKGRICSRPGSHVYNRALLASIINANGLENAGKWAKNLVANLARRPQGNDRSQLKAIFQGQCDIAIINHYYWGKLNYSPLEENRNWVSNIDLIFPNQGANERGVHINVSGGGVVKYSKNKKLAIKLLEFLSSSFSQNLYGEINYEFPVNPDVSLPEKLNRWGIFKEDKLPIVKIAEKSADAQRIIDKVGW